MFKSMLQARISDSAAFMLILQALAEQSQDILRILPRLGVQFQILNESPKFAEELNKRFGESSLILGWVGTKL
jgi:hypothetical protein